MRRMKAAANLLWVLFSILAALALAYVVGVFNPHEKVNGLWLVIAAGWVMAVVGQGVRESYE